MKRICVFSGSSPGDNPIYLDTAKQLGHVIAGRKLTLVSGGADVGTMGAVANAVLEKGGEVIGVIPKSLADKNIVHYGVSDLRIVDSLHERKTLMLDLSDGFIALPGGLGTIGEFFEVLTWAQIGMHKNPCGLINIDGFYDGLLELLDQAVTHKFLKESHRSMMMVDDSPKELLLKFDNYKALEIEKWVDRKSY